MKLTDEICLGGSEVLHKLKKLNPNDKDSSRLFFNEKLYNYIRESVFYAIHIDKDVYNETVSLINTISESLLDISETVENSDEFISRIKSNLSIILKEGYSLMNLCDEKRNDYLIEYGNKYTIK